MSGCCLCFPPLSLSTPSLYPHQPTAVDMARASAAERRAARARVSMVCVGEGGANAGKTLANVWGHLFFFFRFSCGRKNAERSPHRHVNMRAALAINGVLETSAPPPTSARAALASAPRGPYTVLSITPPPRGVPYWQAHAERLAHSLVVLARDGEDGASTPLPSFAQWHASREPSVPLPLPTLVADAVLPTLRAAVAGLGDTQGAPVFAAVLLHEPTKSGTTTPSPASPTLDVLPPVDVLAYAWSPDGDAPPPAPAIAAVVGGPRRAPDAKDSAWIAARAPLEAALPAAGATEGMLADGAGRLLEGLVTNVFVVEGRGEGATLVTAAPRDGVLDGVARRAVLAAADRVGVAVRQAPPDPARVADWSEAFVTSAVVGVRPLAAVSGPGWRAEFGGVPGPVTAALAEALPAVLEHHSLQHL